MAKLRLGLIGAGSWAVASHLPNLSRRAQDVEFVAVCREDGEVLMMVSHDDADVGRADRVIDMRDVNRAAREGS